jgi:hypothetical protein
MATELDKEARDRLIAALTGEETWPHSVSLKPDLKDHMHALGILIARYNVLEFTLFMFLYYYLNDSKTTAPALIFSRLNNQYRIDILKLYVETEADPAVKSRVEAFLSAFGTCTENRNFLAHAQIHGGALTLADLGKVFERRLVLKKAPKGNPLSANYTFLELTELRQLADDIEATNNFGVGLYFFMAARRVGGSFTLAGGAVHKPALPEIPAPPRQLILSDSPDGTDKPNLP